MSLDCALIIGVSTNLAAEITAIKFPYFFERSISSKWEIL